MDQFKSPWNRYFWGALAAIGLLVGVHYCIPPLSAAELSDLPKMQEQMFIPSVQLGTFCSGTVIYSEREKESGEVSSIVLTAKHCVSQVDQRIPVVISNYNTKNREVSKTTYNTKVLGISYKSDLALLRLEDKQTVFTSAKIAPKDVKLQFAQNVWSVSYPLGQSKTFTSGALGYVDVVDAFPGLSTSGEFYRSTPDIAPASSGSGLFTKEGGDYVLIGTLTAGFRGFTFMNLYTPIEEIEDYLSVAKQTYEVKE